MAGYVKRRYHFLDWLRCVGALLIVYNHLGPLRNPEWWVAQLLDSIVNIPLGIIQHFGGFCVCLFFIISGFCLTPSHKSGIKFLINKVIKIIGTLFISTFVFFCLNKGIAILYQPTYWSQFSIKQWLEGATLLCYINGHENAINGAIWYLFPLMCLFILYGLFYSLAKNRPALFVIVVDILFISICCISKFANYKDSRMQWALFTLVPLFGFLIRAAHDKIISIHTFLFCSAINYLVLIECIKEFRSYYYSEQPYLISLIYALLLFIVLMLLEDKIVVPKPVAFISQISFSLYLVHMPWGGLMLTYFNPRQWFTFSFIFVLGILIAIAWVQYRWVEQKLRLK